MLFWLHLYEIKRIVCLTQTVCLNRKPSSLIKKSVFLAQWSTAKAFKLCFDKLQRAGGTQCGPKSRVENFMGKHSWHIVHIFYCCCFWSKVNKRHYFFAAQLMTDGYSARVIIWHPKKLLALRGSNEIACADLFYGLSSAVSCFMRNNFPEKLFTYQWTMYYWAISLSCILKVCLKFAMRFLEELLNLFYEDIFSVTFSLSSRTRYVGRQ